MRTLTALVALALVASGCSSAPTPAPSPTAPQAASTPPALASAVPATSSATPTSTASAVVLPGESWIVYQLYNTTAQTFSLRLIRPDGTGDHLLVDNAHGDPMHPDWSPDGMQVAYVADDKVWVVDVDGLHAKTVYGCSNPCASPDNPAWSPDGTEVAFETADIVDGEAPAGVVLAVDVKSGGRRELLRTKGPEYPRYPRWSDNGLGMVVELDRFKTRKVDDCAATGSAIASVAFGRPDGGVDVLTGWSMMATYPDWNSRGGDRIVFSTIDLGGRDGGCVTDVKPPSDLYTIKADGTGLTQLTHNPTGPKDVRNGTAYGPLSSQPSWAPDGKSIIFVQTTGTEWPGWTMATINADGTGLAPATGAAFMRGTHPRLRPVQ